jgi:ubiquitin-like 1-activating enzyme E1 A
LAKLSSTAEIALYDRQIRLWGVQAQEKIRNANILLITIKALANEVAKNLVLAGIGSLTVIDHEAVTESDLGAQFFVSETDVGVNRAEAAAPHIRRLNPRVNVVADTEDIKLKSPRYFQSFDIIIATGLQSATLNVINTAARANHKPFYAADVHGCYGYIFSDLIQHDYVIEREKGNKETVLQPETTTRSVIDVKTKKENGKAIEMVTKREVYSTWALASDAAKLPVEYSKSRRRLKAVTPLLSCLGALWKYQELNHGRFPGPSHTDLELFIKLARLKHQDLGLPIETLRTEFLREFLQNLGCEIAPVCAVLGGQLAQDIINVLGHRQQPIQNMVFFDGDTNEAPMYALHLDGELGESLLPISASAGQPEIGEIVHNGVDKVAP